MPRGKNGKGIVRKKDLVTAIERQLNIPRDVAERNLDIMTGTIIAACRRGHTVEIRGFGTFKAKHCAERVGFSIVTGEPMVSPEHCLLSFKASKNVNEMLMKKAERAEAERFRQMYSRDE